MEKLSILQVRLSSEESDLLDSARGSASRSAFVRGLIRRAAEGDRGTVADRNEALALLSEQARAGKVPAVIALERALRTDQPSTGEDVPPWAR